MRWLLALVVRTVTFCGYKETVSDCQNICQQQGLKIALTK
jgi:hypothetical protein